MDTDDGSMKGWSAPDWKAWTAKLGNIPMSPGILSVTLTYKLFKQKVLMKREVDLVNIMVSSNGCGSSTTSTPRVWFLRWYGFLDTPGEDWVNETYPCLGDMFLSTGSKAPATSKFRVPCGKQTYCKMYEKMYKMLDHIYPVHKMADAVLAMITKCMSTGWQAQSAPAERWARENLELRTHLCNSRCPYRT